MNNPTIPLYKGEARLQLEPQIGKTNSGQWQHECHSLMRQINRELEGLDERVVPEKLVRSAEEARGRKSAEFELFNQLLIQSGIMETVVKRCWDLIQSFFDRHSGSSGTLVFPDGSKVTVKGLSTEQALELIRDTRAANTD